MQNFWRVTHESRVNTEQARYAREAHIQYVMLAYTHDTNATGRLWCHQPYRLTRFTQQGGEWVLPMQLGRAGYNAHFQKTTARNKRGSRRGVSLTLVVARPLTLLLRRRLTITHDTLTREQQAGFPSVNGPNLGAASGTGTFSGDRKFSSQKHSTCVGVRESVTRQLESAFFGYAAATSTKECVQHQKLLWLLHVLPTPNHRLPKRVLFSLPNPEWCKRRGGQTLIGQRVSIRMPELVFGGVNTGKRLYDLTIIERTSQNQLDGIIPRTTISDCTTQMRIARNKVSTSALPVRNNDEMF
ncbi:hypothetical protein CLF_110092 [Clonorchis sinensis]|uniref:Uncharacterized protein n=1 Tax=Clonorchis sinensis TaxID=79923 RepID=G7YK89_CLOSI|nr:hypothetical protein CLF_110092 [Clonorchis sinensis]